MFLNDKQIQERCLSETPMIEPFVPKQVKSNGRNLFPSFGLSSRGYDIRLDNVFLDPTYIPQGEPFADPSKITPKDYRHIVTDQYILAPGRSVLCHSIERFNIPRDILGITGNKSTYARVFLAQSMTILEPEWEGTLTLELVNQGLKPIPLYAGTGICQILFDWNSEGCEVSYKDRNGKYMGQTQPTVGKL